MLDLVTTAHAPMWISSSRFFGIDFFFCCFTLMCLRMARFHL